MTQCSICKQQYDESTPVDSVYQQAGEWLAQEVWQDAGTICPQCLENRARLAMMYAHDCNT